jgi:SAM-dependent methyltransferase
MLLSYVHDFLAGLESDPAIRDRDTALRKLRTLGLTDFAAVLWSMPLAEYPRLSALLPKMASSEVQHKWTGTSGVPLLAQSLSFIRSVSCNYSNLTGSALSGKRILDFGCGYGRLTRLCYFYSDDVWAVDPWDEALNLCREAGLTGNIFKSEDLPDVLPVPKNFDVIIAYSVLTHTSERTTKAVLRAIRKHLRPGGIACITIRPIEYWNWYSSPDNAERRPANADMERQHRQSGFAFAPHRRQPIDGEITFGDTSLTTDWFADNIPEWGIVARDHSPDDVLQRFLFLRGA